MKNTFFKYICILLLGVCACSSKTDKDKKIITLSVRKSFPSSQSGVVFNMPNTIALNDQGHLFVNDQMASHIVEFDTTGKFLKFIGRKGRGPLEFVNQSGILVSHHKLWVVDQGNMRVSVISTEPKNQLLNSFLIKNVPISMAWHKNHLYSYTQKISFETKIKKPESYSLITVYDKDGHIVRKFGKLFDFIDGMSPRASLPIIKIYKNKLYALSYYYPILQVFDLKKKTNKLLHKIYLSNNIQSYKDLVSKNYLPSTFASPKAMSTRYLFRSMDVNKHGIYIGLYIPYLVIDHYSLKGKFINRYVDKKVGEDFYLHDFSVMNTKDKKVKFIALITEEDISKINIYE